LITNDFKIKSRGKQEIFTYSVDFVEGASTGGAGAEAAAKEKQMETQESLTTMSTSSFGQAKSGPETF